MTIKVGVIGAGAMGSTHVRLLASSVRGAEVVAVADVDLDRAKAVAGAASAPAVYADGCELIADPNVEAVLIASSAATHERLALACLDARKPVLCEKPLAPTAGAARRIVEAEGALGQTLVQVGFMRRYDTGYVEMKRLLDEGEIGDPLLVHCVHRNAGASASFGTAAALTDSVVHEVDVMRWLLGQEIVAVTVLAARASRNAPAEVRDPLVVLFETDGGVLIDVESFVRARYGYDIRCEVVGESGTLDLANQTAHYMRREGRESAVVSSGFQTRFAQAYRDELQAWVHGLVVGQPSGPTAWDGYAASVVTEACLRSLATGERAEVQMESRPGYAGALPGA